MALENGFCTIVLQEVNIVHCSSVHKMKSLLRMVVVSRGEDAVNSV